MSLLVPMFVCMLAYYVKWHLREAWRELLFADTEQAARDTRDPVAPARRSVAAARKAATRTLEDGTPAHSFATMELQISVKFEAEKNEEIALETSFINCRPRTRRKTPYPSPGGKSVPYADQC